MVKVLTSHNFSSLQAYLIEERQYPGLIKLIKKPVSYKELVFVKLILSLVKQKILIKN